MEYFYRECRISTEGQTVATQEFIRSNQQLRRSIDYVDQFAGSSGSRWMIGPGPWMPFGMVFKFSFRIPGCIEYVSCLVSGFIGES
jgi:hypothetical protein